MLLNTSAVRRRRFELGLQQQQLAAAAGISKGHMCDLEAGRYQPSPPLLVKLALILHVAPGELILDGDGQAA